MSYKNALRLSSIINVIIGVSILPYGIIYCTFLFILAFFTLELSMETEESLNEKKNILIILSIVSFVLNIISSILIFIAYDKIDEYNKRVNGKNAPPTRIRKVIDPESKKIDILLKLGVGMVFISGILFATTTWNFISNTTKAFSLLFFGTLFIALSLFSERKLKLYKSSYMYWLLGISFYLLTIVGILYFGVFGNNITYDGIGKNIAYFITFFTITGLSFATYLKFPKRYLLFATYTSTLIMTYNLLKSANLDLMIITIILALISLIINIFTDKESNISNFSNIVSYILFILVLKNTSSNEILLLIASIIVIVNSYYVALKTDSIAEQLLNLIIAYILIFVSIFNFDILKDSHTIIVFLILSMHTLLLRSNVIKTNNIYNVINYHIYIFISIILIYSTENSIYMFLMSLIYFAHNIIYKYNIIENKHMPIEKIIEPISIFILLHSISKLITSVDIGSLVVLATTLIYCLYHYLTKDKDDEVIYRVSIIIGIILCMMVNEGTDYIAILNLLPCIYIFYKGLILEKSSHIAISYILVLFNIFYILTEINIFNISELVSSLIFSAIVLIMILLSDNQIIKKISYFAFIVPIMTIIDYFSFDYKWQAICMSILILYITFLIVYFLIKDNSTKEIASIIGIVISLLVVFDISDYTVGLYIGIVGLIVIAIGYNYKDYKLLFNTGIIITILNILYQLKDLWEKIPFWLYLLIGGLSIIGFVTYRETKKSENNKVEETKEEDNNKVDNKEEENIKK